MDLTLARDILGVQPDDDWTVVRTAYRTRIRSAHPDVAGDAGAADAARLNAAYRRLGIAKREGRLHERTTHQGTPETPRPGPPPPAPSGPVRPGDPPRAVRREWTPPDSPAGDVTMLGSDTIVLSSTPETAFRRLVDATHEIADLSYIDRSSAIFEAVVTLDHGQSASLVISLQWRAHNATTEAFCTLESLNRSERLDVSGVIEQLLAYLPSDPEEV